MLRRIGKVLYGPLLAALVGSTLLARAEPPRKPAAAAAVEPTEAQLPPVDPVWRKNGWHAVVPHAYVVRRLAPARVRPEAAAPAAFSLKGGARVPVLEQDRRWWRVGWRHGRTGWMRVEDLEPHASFVFIDVPSGRVLYRIAAQGPEGPVSEGGFLWTLANTGVTRIAPGGLPVFWSNPAVKLPGRGGLSDNSAWTPDRAAFFIMGGKDGGQLAEISVRTGSVRWMGRPGADLEPFRTDGEGHVLFEECGRVGALLYDASRGREIRQVDGYPDREAKTGSQYVKEDDTLSRYDLNLQLRARRKLDGEHNPEAPRLSADGRVVAVGAILGAARGAGVSRIQLLDADTLVPVALLAVDRHVVRPSVKALVGGNGEWSILLEDQGGLYLARYSHSGRLIRWQPFGAVWKWTMSPDGHTFYAVRDSDILVVSLSDGSTRRIPYRWRRRLPMQFLPRSGDPDSPTRLELSALTLTYDGSVLILTEWLHGDTAVG